MGRAVSAARFSRAWCRILRNGVNRVVWVVLLSLFSVLLGGSGIWRTLCSARCSLGVCVVSIMLKVL